MELQSVIENIGAFTNEAILIADVDPDDGAVMTFRWVNPAFTELMGYTLADVDGKTARMLTGPDTDPVKHYEIIDLLMAWRQFSEEIVLNCKNGDSFWAQMSFQPLEDETSAFRFWIVTIRDVTARKIVEQQQRDLALIAEATQDMVMIMNADRQITWVNPSFEEFTGYTFDEVCGRRIGQVLVAPQAEQATVRDFTKRLDQALSVFGQVLSKKKDGSLYLGEYEVQPVFNEAGKVSRFVSLHRDVTARSSLQQRYNALLNQAGTITYIKQHGRYIMTNNQLAELFGKDQDWFLGKTDDDVTGYPGGSLMGLDETKVYMTGEALDGEQEIRFPNGDVRSYIAKVFRLFEPTLNDYLVCCVATDVTTLKETEQRLRDAQEEAQSAENRLLAAIDAVPEGFALNDSDDRLVVGNKAFRNLHAGIEMAQNPGHTVREAMTQAVQAGLWDTEGTDADEWVSERLNGRRSGRKHEEFRRTVDGRWYQQRVIPIPNGETVTLWIDLTEIKTREVALQVAQEKAEMAQSRLVAAIEALDDSFLIFDSEDKVAVVNESIKNDSEVTKEFQIGATFQSILEEAVERGVIADAIGREPEWISEQLERHNNPNSAFEQNYTDGRSFRIVERKTAQGDTVRLRLDVTQQKEQQQQLEQYAAVLKSSMQLSEKRNKDLEEAKSKIEHDSLHDALTGLANRRYLDQMLKKRIELSRANGSKFAVLHIDLDRFKQINDTLGHDAGDKLLAHVAEILRSQTKESDFAARVGGDEFVILAETSGHTGELARFAKRIVEAMRVPMVYHDQEILFGASIGIAVSTPEKNDPEQVLINADMALYKAKEAGRNRWAFFSDVLHSEMIETKKIADDISRALRNGEFFAQYQPQFRAETMEIVGVEALMRWNHPTRGILMPDDFQRVAREMNQLRIIDQAVLESVVQDLQTWKRAGIAIPKVSINISGGRLRDPELIEDIRRANFEPGTLSIELLESIFLDEDDEVIAWNIDQLRDMGVTIELDDFGTGHSSIVGLIKLKPSRLKIDRQFISPILQAEDKATLVRSIIEIGHSLNVEVVAEGVESRAHGNLLTELKCDVLQGYAYARPMSSDRLMNFLSQRKMGAVI